MHLVRSVGLALALTLGACGTNGSSDPAAASASAAAAPSPLRSDLAGYTREPIVTVGDLSLTNYATTPPEPFAFQAPDDGLLLVYFGYLSCPDVCPLTMVAVRDALAALDPAAADRVAVAMVTVDPERDEGPEITAYLNHFVDRPVALRTDDAAALDAVGARFRARWEIEEHAPGEHYDVAHTAGLYAIDADGRIVREFPFGLEADALARSIDLLLEDAATSDAT